MQQGSPGARGPHLALIPEARCRVFMLGRLYAALAKLVGSWEGGGQASLTMLLVLNSPFEGVAQTWMSCLLHEWGHQSQHFTTYSLTKAKKQKPIHMIDE